jgi:hypothetical protein
MTSFPLYAFKYINPGDELLITEMQNFGNISSFLSFGSSFSFRIIFR